MNLDDIIYVLCLASCIFIGYYARVNKYQSKLFFTIIGVSMMLGISGKNTLHCILSTGMGAASIILVHPSVAHLVTFAIMFGYLCFFRLATLFGLPEPPGHTNMMQMILTLKVSGLAFEKTAAWKKLKQRESEQLKDKPEGKQLVEITEYDVEIQSIHFIEIFHYTFNYIGVLTGPYYRYRTYCDYFETPFKYYAPCMEVTINKLKHAGICCILYLMANSVWPLEYALSDKFMERSLLYRFWYIWPIFFIFRMRIYTGLILSECVCTMAGFGAYPDESEAASGEGPRKQYLHLKRDAEQRSYNFNTIINVYPLAVEKCVTVREAMKQWNVCIQYWLAVNIYKLFPNKKYRTAVTLLVSAYWHGFRPGHYLCIMGAAFYVPIEDIWHRMLRSRKTTTNNDFKNALIDSVFWTCKFTALSYMGIAFVLVSFSNIWIYYSSVYHLGYILWFILLLVGYILHKSKIFTHKRKTVTNEENVIIESNLNPENSREKIH